MYPDFIIIDDNGINNNICQMVIEKSLVGSVVRTFTEPENGLEHIKYKYQLANANNSVILLLDINMPTLNGWEVLEQFEQLPKEVQQMFKIFMLSSSVTQQDKTQAQNHPFVNGYIEKPLTIARLKSIIPDLID